MVGQPTHPNHTHKHNQGYFKLFTQPAFLYRPDLIIIFKCQQFQLNLREEPLPLVLSGVENCCSIQSG